MDTRRDFLKKAAFLTAGGGLLGVLPASIQQALAIDPAPGSTYLDAEHIVILMQENRSFDHSYGTLRGVRGFDDPRGKTLPDGNPVWFQTDANEEVFAPFRLNIKDTQATWMGSLPHSWVDQVDACNNGKHDKWLIAKRSGHKENAKLPLTLGFYNREDIPFYYAMADAFTVCDQNFCSSLTGTTPNRLYLWTGTVREKPSILSKANVRNEDVDYGSEASWTTFPERLEENGISWRIYQNELSLPVGFQGEEESWLANFTDNPIEWFTQYHVRFSGAYRKQLANRAKDLPGEIAKLEAEPDVEKTQKQLTAKRNELKHVQSELEKWTEEAFAKLPEREKNLHRKAFTTNINDPDYHDLTTLTYKDGGTERAMQVPKGDVLHQFRDDVRTGKLPTVSWLVAPENFSDHPGAPWYGAWYLSEALDILTQNPEVWKKTIFILCYDENDGYFDHIPPFAPPYPDKPETGKVSAGIDVSVEHVRMEQEQERQKSRPGAAGRSGPIGLGPRVPLVIASPWSRGGYVNSQVCDHTSIVQLMEKILSHKTGKEIRETNISEWRRTVCGDLTSVFRPYRGEKMAMPKWVEREPFLGSIHQAQFKQVPNGFKSLNSNELKQSIENPQKCAWMPRQEKGSRPSCALPYELAVTGALSADKKSFQIDFSAGKEVFGTRAAGSAFHTYAPGKFQSAGKAAGEFENGRTWSYAVSAGDTLSDTWSLGDFADGNYHLRVHGPNGFYREFRGTATGPAVEILLTVDDQSKRPKLRLVNQGQEAVKVVIKDVSYGARTRTVKLSAAGKKDAQAGIVLDFDRSHGWYDLSIQVDGVASFEQRLAGRIETGRESMTDPLIGKA